MNAHAILHGPEIAAAITRQINRRNKFDPAFETRLAFPCCVCLHRHGSDRDEPCNKCEHNLNAEAA